MQATQIRRLAWFLDQCAPNGGDTALISGFTTITPPAGHDLILFVPSPGDATTFLLKKLTGDAGIAISNVYPTLITTDGVGGAVGITASATTKVEIHYGKTATGIST
jgi:hypothetical protein